MKSILGSVRKMIGGIAGEESPFDSDLIIHINSVFTIVNQLGVGPKEVYSITGEDETWDDFFSDTKIINLVKSYVYLKVKILFDPPTSGVLHEALERQITEAEWRLRVQGDHDLIEKRKEVEDETEPDEYYG